MALTGLHTDWIYGSYTADRDKEIKKAENAQLAKNKTTDLNAHADTVGNSIAVGYGYDLKKNLKTLKTDLASYVTTSSDLDKVYNLVNDYFNNGNPNKFDDLEDLATEINKYFDFGTEAKASDLLAVTVDKKESLLDAYLGYTMPQSKERAALVDLVYNAGKSMFKVTVNGIEQDSKLTQAIKNGNRAEAWFEIRYNSNGGRSASPGIANRRYAEAHLFGLYDSGSTFTEAEAKEVLRMYTKHRGDIIDYESKYIPPLGQGVLDIRNETGLAKNYLIDNFAKTKGVTIDGDVIVGAGLDSYAKLETWSIDKIEGTNGNDLIFGEKGSDILDGGAGDDVIYGGEGNDMITGGQGNDYIEGGAGNDNLHGDSADTALSDQGDDYIDGEAGDDTINGYAGNDTIYGGSGMDTIWGGTGDNIMYGEDDNDTLNGDSGSDYIDGGLGDDSILAGDGNNVIYGDDGADRIWSGSGDDYIEGGAGNDMIVAGNGINTIYGDDGNDTIEAGGGDDYIDGEGGDDTLLGYAGNDTIFGGDGTDLLQGDIGNDYLDGEAGADTITGGAGTDTLFGGDGNDHLYGDGGNDTLDGGLGDDSILAGDGNNVIYGDDGADRIWAGSGEDQIAGGTGDDFMQGDTGSDTYIFNLGDGSDTIYETNSDSNDINVIELGLGIQPEDVIILNNSGDFVLTISGTSDQLTVRDWRFAQVQPIQLIRFADGTQWDAAAIRQKLFTGTEGDDNLAGTESADTISGLGGNDTLIGNSGEDIIDGSSGMDRIYGGGEADTIYGGDGDDNLSGDYGYLYLPISQHSYGDDHIYGDAGNDTIDGGRGNDYISGGDGNDRLDGDNGTTYLSVSEHGNDYIYGDAGNDTINGGGGSDHIYGGNDNDNLHGNAGDDTLDGGDGDDMLYDCDWWLGMTDHGVDYIYDNGNDTLIGGAGNDEIHGGGGSDTYVFNLGDGSDTIYETNSGNNDTNVIELGQGIRPNDVSIAINSGSFVLTIAGASDQLTVVNWNYAQIQLIRFADGSSWDAATIHQKLYTATEGDDNLAGTESADTISGLGGNDIINGKGGDDYLLGESGNDQLHGDAGNDILDGGAGDDILVGNDGDDKYIFGRGSGNDKVYLWGGGNDTIVLDSDIRPEDIILWRYIDNWNDITNDLMVSIGSTSLLPPSAQDRVLSTSSIYDKEAIVAATTDSVLISGWFSNPDARIQFADGTVWDSDTILQWYYQGNDRGDIIGGRSTNDTINGGAGDDYLYGKAGDDFINGGDGSDQLYGDEGNDTFDGGPGADGLLSYYGGSDTFLFGRGSGHDSVRDDGFPQDVDTIVFGSDVLPQDVIATRYYNNLILTISDTGDYISIYDVFTYETPSIERIQFANGTVWDVAALKQSLLMPSEGNDYISGSPNADTIMSLGGNDTIYGREGNDIIDGGTGDDMLYGETGNDILDGGTGDDFMQGDTGDDTYKFNIGSGMDTIYNYADDYAASTDTIEFGSGIMTDGIVVIKDGSNLKITINGTSDVLVISNWYEADANKIDRFKFSDGTMLTTEQIEAYAAPAAITGTPNNDTLTGTDNDDRIEGLVGNDTLNGGAGNDILDGGTGSDKMTGGRGDDTYVVDNTGDTVTESSNGGNDTVQSSITYTLGSNVENLTLTGSSNINGTGNSRDNTIIGNSASNTLTGGSGQDYLDGGAGNDTLKGGTGSDTYFFGIGDGSDIINDYENDYNSTTDSVRFGEGINPLDLIFSKSGSDLQVSINGTSDKLSVYKWYSSRKYKTEMFQSSDGSNITYTQVEQLIQAMASFTSDNGMSWSDAIQQRPQDVNQILAQYWNPQEV